MAAPLPHGCHLSSLHFPHHRNMKTECSRLKEDEPLLRSSIHAPSMPQRLSHCCCPCCPWCGDHGGHPRRSPTLRQGCSPTRSCAQQHHRLDVGQVISSATNLMVRTPLFPHYVDHLFPAVNQVTQTRSRQVLPRFTREMSRCTCGQPRCPTWHLCSLVICWPK